MCRQHAGDVWIFCEHAGDELCIPVPLRERAARIIMPTCRQHAGGLRNLCEPTFICVRLPPWWHRPRNGCFVGVGRREAPRCKDRRVDVTHRPP